MRYEVHYLIGGEEQTELVEASDAAEAAAAIQDEHGRTPESFELLSVNRVDDLTSAPVDETGATASSLD